MRKGAIILAARIERAILILRGNKILLDADFAALYEVPTKVLLQAVKRNLDRFPQDFMFQLSADEFEALRSRIVTSKNPGRGGRRYAPYAFTEQGVAMLSSVLNSPRAIAVNIEIMRAFVRLRELIASNKELAAKLDQLEKKFTSHDQAITEIMLAIRQLMAPPEPTKKTQNWLRSGRVMIANPRMSFGPGSDLHPVRHILDSNSRHSGEYQTMAIRNKAQ
jgi:hypothetical protein